MRVAIIDVGSNTARLLVANVTDKGTVVPIAEEREYLRLGAEIERTGTLSPKKIAAAADTCGGFAARIAKLDVERATVIVTAPGRQGAAAPELKAALADATSLPVRVLTAESEGRLAYDGAVARTMGDLPEIVGVVDVGGGSTEVVVGTPFLGAAWVQSADIGSLRLTRAHLTDDPPSAAQVRSATEAVAHALAEMSPPRPALALAVGGSARALTKIVGRRFDADDLERAVKILSRRPAAKAARPFGIAPERAETLLAGALLLAGTSRVLGAPFQLGSGGLREGAARVEQRGGLVEHERVRIDQDDPRERELLCLRDGQRVTLAADRVAVVVGGLLPELCSHDQLTVNDGAYAALWESWQS
jgi:exopolyphosphatase/guanosine-5'-triphosphate,3'-diphosphate pyrophosphatase